MVNTTSPKVSVIVPVYNTAPYLEQCLKSIIAQSLQDIEIICVDDGSTDNSLNILYAYQKKDSRILVLKQEHRNAGAARNKGLAIASGTYLTFLDSDDYFSLDMLEKCYHKMEQEESDIIVFSAQQFDVRTSITTLMPWSLNIKNCPSDTSFSPKEMNKYLFNSFQNWPWNKMFRKSLIDRYSLRFQEISRTNDMAFVCAALAMAGKISVINRPFVTYRVGTGISLQSTNDESPLSFWDAFLETRQRLINLKVYENYKQSFLNNVLSGLLYNFHSTKSQEAKAQILDLVINRVDFEMELSKYPEEYYYEPHKVSEYKKLLNAKSMDSNGKVILILSNNVFIRTVKNIVDNSMDCIRDHGIVYTIKYSLKRLVSLIVKNK